jgi:hypothetical protein
MAYDASKDVQLNEWAMFGEDAEANLFASVMQYNGGEKKFQVGPRTYINKKGEVKFQKVGRLTKEEVEWLASIMGEVVDFM